MTHLEREYASRGLLRGDQLLLRPEVAVQFLDDCRARNIEVLGFDGFRILADKGIQPLLQDILDFDWRDVKHLSYPEKLELAKRQIGSRIGSDTYFEIVITDGNSEPQ
jgi:hypothetical protein